MTRASATAEVRLGGTCSLSCAPCDCRQPRTDDPTLARTLSGGGRRIVLRGAATTNPLLASVVDGARRAGFGEVVVRTHAVGVTEAEARRLRDLGVDRAIVPIFSHVARVHDRIAGRDDALVGALLGMRALHHVGVAVEVEVPLLAARLQRPDRVVELAKRAVPELRAAHFHIVRSALPSALAPAAWDGQGATVLASALHACRSLDVHAELGGVSAVPLCALREHPDLHDAFSLAPRGRSNAIDGCVRPDATCGRCAVRRSCPGVAQSYAAAHGTQGIVPYAARPRGLYPSAAGRRRRHTPEQWLASRDAERLVLRPTVNCNQDCTFCSANETSSNVWPDPGLMRRQIARAARRGVRLVSFSGGEPTLTPELESYVEVASRLGVPAVELITNGVLLNPKRVQRLRAAGLTHAFVSLHGHSEEISRLLTLKDGDWERTVRAVDLLVESKVLTALNHVINAHNARHLERFVRFAAERWGGIPLISFAFVTPQFRALQNIGLMPRMSDVMPDLARAMGAALELGQPVVVGSRQGIPPCVLGGYAPWSDLFGIVNEAVSEDRHQKVRAPGCDDCRYTRYCLGVWRAYADRYGLDELRPIEGAPFGPEDVEEFQRWRAAGSLSWGMPGSFEEAWPPSRSLDAERDPPWRDVEQVVPSRVHLPLVAPARSRPVRLALIGTGHRAARIAREALAVSGLAIEAVASPHASDADLRDFGSCPSFTSLADVLDDVRPDGVIIAAATDAHHELATAALSRGVPVLMEKPLTSTLPQAEELVALVERSGVALMPAHNVLFAHGLERFFGVAASDVTMTKRTTPSSPDAPRAWSRGAVYETLYHVLVLAGRAAGGGAARVLDVQHRGVSTLERLRLRLAYPALDVNLLVDFTAAEDSLEIEKGSGDSIAARWSRVGRDVMLTLGGTTQAVERRGSEIGAMLLDFRAVVIGEREASVGAREGLDVMLTARAVLDALETAGAPLERRGGPRHASSRAFRERL